jgi:hypothetical protein
MKRIFCLSVVFLILVGVGCAAMTPKTTLTKENQAALKGKWVGTADFGSGQNSGLIIEITNDAPPYKGTIEFANIPAAAAQYLGNFSNSTKYAGPFDTGMITNKGTFIITGQGGNFGEFNLVGTTTLDGWFYLWGAKGTAILTKK